MSLRTSLWLLFVLLFFVLPFPMWGPWSPLAPTARYALLSGATALVAALEGAAGPVPLILALFAVHTVVYAAACWLLAWFATKALSPLAPETRRRAVFALAFVAIAVALAFDLYRTPFGRTPTANLWTVLS